ESVDPRPGGNSASPLVSDLNRHFSLDSGFSFLHTQVHGRSSGRARPTHKGKRSPRSSAAAGRAPELEPVAVVPAAVRAMELAECGWPTQGHGRAELVSETRPARFDLSASPTSDPD